MSKDLGHFVCVIRFDTISTGDDISRIMYSLARNGFDLKIEEEPLHGGKSHPEYGAWQLIVSKRDKI